jgi:ABC-type ATPase involved in cell division
MRWVHLYTKTSYEVMDLIQGINDEGRTILVVTTNQIHCVNDQAHCYAQRWSNQTTP